MRGASAADAVTPTMRATVSKETANELRRIELARLVSMWMAVYPKALNGDLKAVDRCLRIMECRAAISGLNAPQKVRMPVITQEDFLKAIEAIEAQAAGFEEAFVDVDSEEDVAEG
jgi:hypothetical protein